MSRAATLLATYTDTSTTVHMQKSSASRPTPAIFQAYFGRIIKTLARVSLQIDSEYNFQMPQEQPLQAISQKMDIILSIMTQYSAGA